MRGWRKVDAPRLGDVRSQAAMLRLVNRGRYNPEILAEHPAEMRRDGEAPRERNVRDRLSGLRLQFVAAMLQPSPPDLIADGHAAVAEQHVQIAFGAAQCRGNLIDAQFRVAQMFAMKACARTFIASGPARSNIVSASRSGNSKRSISESATPTAL